MRLLKKLKHCLLLSILLNYLFWNKFLESFGSKNFTLKAVSKENWKKSRISFAALGNRDS